MSRTSALLRLASAYGRHQLARRVGRRPPTTAEDVLALYAGDRLHSLTADERLLLPQASRCISCGLCAIVAGRVGGARPADLAGAYLRDYPALGASASDLDGPAAALSAAAAACPVGVPLEAVATMVRRLSQA